MKPLSQCRPCLCLAAWGRKLSKIQLQGDYEMDLGAYEDDQGDRALFSHRCNGSLSYSLCKLLAILGAIWLGMTILHALCRLLSRLSD